MRHRKGEQPIPPPARPTGPDSIDPIPAPRTHEEMRITRDDYVDVRTFPNNPGVELQRRRRRYTSNVGRDQYGDHSWIIDTGESERRD